ncbi:AraC family transcriptional regulator [Cryobacterium sp. 5B3]|uniref:AraC family transcriptional regulator n=1 Tax=Cryobacterium sp. 5B3 TaxID=3048586 RepID=UPI002AB51AAD|nr:AraC family transcriptional regulator [Cryobacterium sp. 5B3]MDY7542468.1 AraC family transcriptional regulator [Cryobacterium sp. 5B3]MEB0275307.1 AraC family transcriptional regulator [Cryobacterium sp. 5B3]
MEPRRAVIVNSMISGHFEIYHVDNAVREHANLHYHDFHEINCVLSGTGVFRLGGTEYSTEPGTVTFVRRNDLHNIVRQSSEYYERAYIHIREEFLTSRSSESTNLNLLFAKDGTPTNQVIRVDADWLRDQISRLADPDQPGFGADLVRENRLIEFLIELNKAVFDSENAVVPHDLPVSALISAVMGYVADNLDEDLSLDAVAGRFFISKYYLSRQFKTNTGLNFHQYTLKKRLLHSKDLLSTHGNALDVYRIAGFSSYTHFLRCFKDEFGMTTKEFIRRSRNPEGVHFENPDSP